MFFADALLTKNGKLAQVWLVSNLERKLSKKDALSSNIQTNVRDIMHTGQTPLALRLSGQLLLGVVRIYSRKARYLLDDCSEALTKIKMAFRPGNVDLPSHQSHTANANALILPDTITELDLFAPLPDPEDLLLDEPRRAPGQDPTLLDYGTSQFLPSTGTPAKRQNQTLDLGDDDLGLDIGLDDDLAIGSTPAATDRSIEIGRRATSVRRDEPSMLLGDDDLGLDIGLDADTTIHRPSSMAPPQADNDAIMGMDDDDYPMGGMNTDAPTAQEIQDANAAALAHASSANARARDTVSPLSSIRSSVEYDLEHAFELDRTAMEGDDDPTMVQAQQRVRRRKVLQQDAVTELAVRDIKKMQEDRSGITKAPSFLPHDPVLLQLMQMSKNGSLASQLLGDGRLAGWAPELRGILSLELVRKSGELKRKRDSGVADVNSDDAELGAREKTPRLELPEDEDSGFPAAGDNAADFDANTTLRSDGILSLGSDGLRPPTADAEDNQDTDYPADDLPPFDITEAPLLHPSQSGPVSLGTRNAVHLLREHFAPGHTDSFIPPTPSKRTKNEALFTDLCPPRTTSRADATKLFFEMLVLGTKDAVKVEQGTEELGMPIRMRGKRGLWGDWAERGAGGEIASQELAGSVEVAA